MFIKKKTHLDTNNVLGICSILRQYFGFLLGQWEVTASVSVQWNTEDNTKSGSSSILNSRLLASKANKLDHYYDLILPIFSSR